MSANSEAIGPQPVSANDDEPVGTGVWIGFLGMVFGVFMSVGDIQIVASSLEQIQAGLSCTSDEIAWVQSAYLIAEVVVIPLSGWLGKALSTRWLYVISCGGFTAMSLACALSWDLPSMIAFRALQGLFGGAMIPVVFSSVYLMFPPRLQGVSAIVIGLVVTLAPVTGPVFGGFLTAMISWKAMFAINVVPGLLVCLSTWLFVHIDEADFSLLKHIDFPGIFYICVFLGGMQFVLEEGARLDWLESPLIVSLCLLSTLGCVALIRRELTISNPVVDLRAFRDFNFAMGCLFSFLLGAALCSIIYMMPVYLSTVRGLNSLQIGEYVMVTGMFQFLSAFVAGSLGKRMDPRAMLGVGMFLLGLGAWINGILTAESGYWEFFLPQAIRGLALLFCFLPINTLALGSLPPEEVLNASGLYNLMRNIGGAMGLAWANTSLIQWSKAHYAVLREHVTEADLPVQNLLDLLDELHADLSTADNGLASLSLLYHAAMREAQVASFNELFQVIGFVACASALLTPLLKKPRATALETGH